MPARLLPPAWVGEMGRRSSNLDRVVISNQRVQCANPYCSMAEPICPPLTSTRVSRCVARSQPLVTRKPSSHRQFVVICTCCGQETGASSVHTGDAAVITVRIDGLSLWAAMNKGTNAFRVGL